MNSGSDDVVWKPPVVPGMVSLHFVNEKGIIVRRNVLRAYKLSTSFISSVCTKSVFPVTVDQVAAALVEPNTDIKIVTTGGTSMDDVLDVELDTWCIECPGVNVYVAPSSVVVDMIAARVFPTQHGEDQFSLSNASSGYMGSSQGSGTSSTSGISQCAKSLRQSLVLDSGVARDDDGDTTLTDDHVEDPPATRPPATADSKCVQILSHSSSPPSTLAPTLPPPTHAATSPPPASPPQIIAATDNQGQIPPPADHTTAATNNVNEAGPNRVGGPRVDNEDWYDDQDVDRPAEVGLYGHLDDPDYPTIDPVVAQGDPDSLCHHVGVDLLKLANKSLLKQCTLSVEDMLDVYDIAEQFHAPPQMIKLRRDFSLAQFRQYQQGDNQARKVFFYAKRLLFSAMYKYMLKKMAGGFCTGNMHVVGVSLWYHNQWCMKQYWIASPDDLVHIPPFCYLSSANAAGRGLWHAYVYHIREPPRSSTSKIQTSAGIEINLRTFRGVCAQPPVPDPSDMLAESRKLREADEFTIGMKHMAVSKMDHVPENLVVSSSELNKERSCMLLTYALRRARFDGHVSWFNVARQIEQYPGLIYNGLAALDEFTRMRQSIVRYSPHCAAYDRASYEYLLNKMCSASIRHFAKNSRMECAKAILGSLPISGDYLYYDDFFHLPYDDFLLVGLRCAMCFVAKSMVSIQANSCTVILPFKADLGLEGALSAVRDASRLHTARLERLPIMVIPTLCGSFNSLLHGDPYLVIDGHATRCPSAAVLISRWFESFWIFNCPYPGELRELMQVMECVYGFLPIHGSAYGPLTLSKPTSQCKTLCCLISEVVQSDGYIMSGVKLNKKEIKERLHLQAHADSPHAPAALVKLGVVLPDGSHMRAVRPDRRRIVVPNAHAAEAERQAVEDDARRVRVSGVAIIQRKDKKLREHGLGSAVVEQHLDTTLAAVAAGPSGSVSDADEEESPSKIVADVERAIANSTKQAAVKASKPRSSKAVVAHGTMGPPRGSVTPDKGATASRAVSARKSPKTPAVVQPRYPLRSPRIAQAPLDNRAASSSQFSSPAPSSRSTPTRGTPRSRRPTPQHPAQQ